ncbi:hypothetical protein IEU95_13625 [Hoyosella rhizosphaerae]|uniref:Uncharacterized protein n=1 Tax=Hoyosella rhizosphaerae TaxID=1755582 RepID=A0A916UFT4_9ACTN|nr:hypothetical protein [Hoyosella rhizosphaerae]MBN4927879.1 hypothetical protein [Hoyosella rhizosphaerae]GGC70684.1 hypothetical protein GCM10011410_24450 [Hoyosella rhizosphaerae]
MTHSDGSTHRHTQPIPVHPDNPSSYASAAYGSRSRQSEWARQPVRRDNIAIRFLRGLAGACAAGLVVLTAMVALVNHFAADWGIAGPGTEALWWHLIGASLAVFGQVAADRTRGLRSIFWSVAVFTIVTVVLFTQWWS